MTQWLLVTCFRFIYTREAFLHRGLLTTIFYITYLKLCRENLPQAFSVEICRRNLPRLLAMRICRRNLPWKFGVATCDGFFCICKQVLLCVYQQILFIWKQTFFIFEQNYFLCEIWQLWVTVCYRNLISRTAGRPDNLSEIFHALLHVNQ